MIGCRWAGRMTTSPSALGVNSAGTVSSRQTTDIARRSRGVVAPQTPWQSPASSAQARHAPCTSQPRQSESAASGVSLGAGKNVSGSCRRQTPRDRQDSSVRCSDSRRSENARTSRGSRRAAATSCGRGVRARVITHLPRGYNNCAITVLTAMKVHDVGAVFYRTRQAADKGLAAVTSKAAECLPNKSLKTG
jgi:hypothetical protein